MAQMSTGTTLDFPQSARRRTTGPLPIAGFGGGTLIATDDGYVPVDWLRAGDKVQTYSDGFQTVRWVGRDCFNKPPEDVQAVTVPLARPGDGLSVRNPVLAARHRVVLTGWQVELNFGMDAILAEAAMISPSQRFFPPVSRGTTSCSLILMDRPQIIQANGCWVETLHLTEGSIACLSDIATDAIDRLKPDLAAHRTPPLGCMNLWEAEQLALDLPSMIAHADVREDTE